MKITNIEFIKDVGYFVITDEEIICYSGIKEDKILKDLVS